MDHPRKVLALLLCAVMMIGIFPMSAIAAETNGLDNFKKVSTYEADKFSDVSTSDWYYVNVKAAYELGLMIGQGEKFGVDSDVTVAETVTLAARLHSIYSGDNESFTQGTPWYQVYVDYVTSKNFVSLSGLDMTAPATRAQYANILGAALPDEALESVNNVADDAIPDVKMGDSYALAIYRLYRAGILTGKDEQGTYDPDSNIKRSEVASIVTRMADKSLRKTVMLGDLDFSAPTPSYNIVLSVSPSSYNISDDTLVLQDSSVTLTGRVTGTDSVSRITIKYFDYTQETHEILATGTTNWSAEIPLTIGTNTVTIIAEGIHGTKSSKTVFVNRTNDVFSYSDTVKVADEEDYQELEDGFVACWLDENATWDDETDDTIVLLVRDDSLLLSQIEQGNLAVGDVYMIPQNDIFVTGFTGKYVRTQPPRGSEDYPLSEYPDEGYEEIIFEYPNFLDLFDGDISIDFTTGIDPNNPVAFAMLMDGTELPVEVSVDDGAYGKLSASNVVHKYLASGIANMYPRAGWQWEELLHGIAPSAKYSNDQYGRHNITLKWGDIVIYDKDGVKNDDGDDRGQATISGEFGIKNLQHTGCFEWHPNLAPWDFHVLPQQIMSKTTYDLEGELEFKLFNLELTTKELIKKINRGFENKAEFWGLQLSGVDTLDTKIPFCVVGLNLLPPGVSVYTSIKQQAVQSTLSPSVIIILFMDLNGKVGGEVTLGFSYGSSVEKGFNIQENGYTGAYGSQAQNRSDKHYDVGSKHTLDVYDKNDADFTIALGGTVEASLDVGFGAGIGLMLGGLVPAMVNGELFYRARGIAEGEVKFTPTQLPDNPFSATGYAALYTGLGVQADASAKLMLKKGDWRLGGFDINKHWEHMFWETTLATSYLDGAVYVSDTDSDDDNNAVIEGANVTLKKNDTGHEWTQVTDHNGKFHFASIPDGEYTIHIEKDGYSSFTDSELIFSKKKDGYNVFLNEINTLPGICRLIGKIIIADDDVDLTNNAPLQGAEIVLVNNSNNSFMLSTMTADDGTYSFDQLPDGNYTITVIKTGYFTIVEAVSVAANVENYYNATLESISTNYSGTGDASGTIYDALNGRPVSGLTLRLRSGHSITTGTVDAVTTTDENGQYKFIGINAGNYSIEIVDERILNNESERYYLSNFNIKVLGDHSIPNQNGYVTNGLATDQLRVVLKWGEYPSDLDSHLVGPDGNNGKFHVYFSQTDAYLDSVQMANLDLDDTSSYGPETTTIYRTSPGVYTFLVHNYSHKTYDNSTSLANSGAYVEVYLGVSNIASYTFYVPNMPGTLWTVFQFDSSTGIITPINQMEYESSSNHVGAKYS